MEREESKIHLNYNFMEWIVLIEDMINNFNKYF